MEVGWCLLGLGRRRGMWRWSKGWKGKKGYQ